MRQLLLFWVLFINASAKGDERVYLAFDNHLSRPSAPALHARVVPAAAVSRSRCRAHRSASAAVVHPVDAQDGRDQPADGRQEAECNVGLPLVAAIIAVDVDAGPVKDVAARAVQPVNEQAECDEPADGQHEVDRPVDEAAGEGEQPDYSEQDGQAGNDLGEDEAALVPGGGAVDGVEVVACEAGGDGGEGELFRLLVCVTYTSFSFVFCATGRDDLLPRGGGSC